jgi:hypothetical protein
VGLVATNPLSLKPKGIPKLLISLRFFNGEVSSLNNDNHFKEL